MAKLPPPKTPAVSKKKALSTETPVGSKSKAVAVTPARPWGGTAKKKISNNQVVSRGKYCTVNKYNKICKLFGGSLFIVILPPQIYVETPSKYLIMQLDG